MSERDIRAENLAYWQEKLADNRELRLLQLANLAKGNVACGRGRYEVNGERGKVIVVGDAVAAV